MIAITLTFHNLNVKSLFKSCLQEYYWLKTFIQLLQSFYNLGIITIYNTTLESNDFLLSVLL